MNSLHSDETKAGPEYQEILSEQVRSKSLQIIKRLPALGPVIMLYMQSSHRRYQFIGDLEWLLLPPLVNGQCKLYMKKEFPVSFISWAFLDESAEKRLLANGGKLRPEDWNCGDRLWVVDAVAPFGGVEKMLHDVRKSEFPDHAVRIMIPDLESGSVKARKLPPYSSVKIE